MERSRRLQFARTKSHRLANGRKRRRQRFGTDKDYGPSCCQPDVSQETYNVLKEEHLQKLRMRQSNWYDIERATADQSDCDLWHTLRKEMLTASKFGEICRMREFTSCARLVKAIRYPKALDVAHVADGKEHENEAREQLARELGREISLSGLFIDPKIPFLGASPDGLIDDGHGIVEIKYMAKAAENGYTPEEAIEKFPLYRNIFAKNSTEVMNKNHKHFYQVQGQLHVTDRQYCIFALWAPLGMKYVRVERDDEFWTEKMQEKLTDFHEDCLLPEIVDGRQNRNMKIREPQRILQAQEQQKAKKAGKLSRNRAASAIEPPLESMEVDSETVVDLSSTNNDADLRESPIPCMAVDNGQERIDKEVLEQFIRNIDPEAVQANVLDADNYLEDTSIEYFLRIVAENCDYNIAPVLYFAYPGAVKPSNTEHDLLIIGGRPEFKHWCCIRIEGTTLFVYDSLGRKALRDHEKAFIRKMYPRIRINSDIVFPDVARQPDDTSCGAYAAAFATALALGQDPSNPKHSGDAIAMRQRMALICELRDLLPFPTE